MTTKRFELCEINCFDYGIKVFNEIMDKGVPLSQKQVCELLNGLHEEKEQLKDALNQRTDQCDEYYKENEQLKQDNNTLIHLLENQSIIIQELHLKLLEYQVKEPITLTKEDLELMGKAISYYTHRRCGE